MAVRSISNVAATWTNAGIVYTGIGINVYATSYSSISKPFDIRVNNTSVFSVNPEGTIKNNSLDITFNTANAAYNFANNMAVSTGQPVFAHRHANAAFDVANAALQNTTATFSGVLTATGNIVTLSSFVASGNVRATGNVYGQVFYNSKDPTNYVDPTNISYLNDIRANIFYQRDDTNSRWDSGYFVLRGTSPTIYFRDTDHNSAMLHNNSNLFYILRGANDTETYTQVSGQWPLTVNLTNNDATVGGSFSAIGNVTAYASDKRLKTNIQEIPNAIEKIKRVRGVTFDWNDISEKVGFVPENKYNDIGCIAQEVEEVLPHAVVLAPFDKWSPDPGTNYTDEELKRMETSKSGENYKTIQYEKMIPLLIQAVKEQQEQIEKQQILIDELKTRLG